MNSEHRAAISETMLELWRVRDAEKRGTQLDRLDLLDGIPLELSRRWSETMARHLKDDRAKRGAA